VSSSRAAAIPIPISRVTVTQAVVVILLLHRSEVHRFLPGCYYSSLSSLLPLDVLLLSAVLGQRQPGW
jgi:uncharacterized membrane protein (DUF4010 family)